MVNFKYRSTELKRRGYSSHHPKEFVVVVVVVAIKQQKPQCSASMGREDTKNRHHVVKVERGGFQKAAKPGSYSKRPHGQK